jgi:hypothetical protein
MSSVTRTRILITVIFLLPLVVMALFWLFGNSPPDPAATLPMMPPK